MELSPLEGKHNCTNHMFNLYNIFYYILDTSSMYSEQQQDQSLIDTLSGTCILIEI